MSDFICACPLPASLPPITPQTCKETFGLIGKLAFRRLGTPMLDVTDETEWQTDISADTIQLTPFELDNQDFPSSEPITVGGDDNSTFSGASIIVGETSITVTWIIRDLPFAAYRELKAYVCEIQSGATGVAFLGNNFIISNGNEFIKPTSFFIGTPLLGGRIDTNNYPITLTLPAGWIGDDLVLNNTTWNPMDKVNV